MVDLVQLVGIFLLVSAFTILWKNNPLYVFAQGIQKGSLAAVLLFGSILSLWPLLQAGWWRYIPVFIFFFFSQRSQDIDGCRDTPRL